MYKTGFLEGRIQKHTGARQGVRHSDDLGWAQNNQESDVWNRGACLATAKFERFGEFALPAPRIQPETTEGSRCQC